MRRADLFGCPLFPSVPFLNTFIVAITFFFFTSIAYSSSSASEIFWGPEDFVRGTSAPITVSKEISIKGFEAPFKLHLKNGDDDGKHRISSGYVWLNGELLFGPSDFSQKVSGYEIPVNVIEPSTLEIKNDSIPGSKITISIEGIPSGPPRVLLEGAPESPALEAIYDYYDGDYTSDDEIILDSHGNKIDGSNLEIALSQSAKIGEVNALLETVDATIIAMQEKVGLLVVKIPTPENMEDLESIINLLEQSPFVHYVNRAYMLKPSYVPIGISISDSFDLIANHIAVRAPAAWEAGYEIPTDLEPTLIIADDFGYGPPDGTYFDINVDNYDFITKIDEGATDEEKEDAYHGYQVLSVISAKHSQENSIDARYLVTGMYPYTLNVRVVNTVNWNSIIINHEIVNLVKASTSGNVLVNTSLGHFWDLPEKELENRARSWIRQLRTDSLYFTGYSDNSVSLENKFLHVTSAGNMEEEDDPFDAALDSDWNMARLGVLTTFEDEDLYIKSLPLERLKNTLVIENRKTTSTQPYKPGCLHASSMQLGDLSAIGTDVLTLTNIESIGTEVVYGTSFSAPQVTGLAAFVWRIKPTLKPEKLLDLLKMTSTPASDTCTINNFPMPVIDAYAAVLATDDKSALLASGFASDAPARREILDVNEDGLFNEHDISAILLQLSLSPGNPDYSRYDLNGDGRTGGETTAEFNLDIDDQNILEKVSYTIDDMAISLDESKVKDRDVLCYYAYSPLYNGDLEIRDQFLDDVCYDFVLIKRFERNATTAAVGSDRFSSCDEEREGYDEGRDWQFNTFEKGTEGFLYGEYVGRPLEADAALRGGYAHADSSYSSIVKLEGNSMVYTEDGIFNAEAHTGSWTYYACGVGELTVPVLASGTAGGGTDLTFHAKTPFRIEASIELQGSGSQDEGNNLGGMSLWKLRESDLALDELFLSKRQLGTGQIFYSSEVFPEGFYKLEASLSSASDTLFYSAIFDHAAQALNGKISIVMMPVEN